MNVRQAREVLCSVIALLYSYGIAGKVEGRVLVDEDSVLAACKKLGIDPRLCIEGFEILKAELGLERILAVELPSGSIVVDSDPVRLSERLSAYISELTRGRRGARRESRLRSIDGALGIWSRIRWYYAGNEDKLLEYWFSRGLECGASLAVQTSKQACLAIAGLLIRDEVPWSTFQKLIVNSLYFGLKDCYTLYVEYGVDGDAIDALLVRERECTDYPYELIVVEVKSRGRRKLLVRGGEQDPIAQLKRYVEKVAEAYPDRRSILGLLVTIWFCCAATTDRLYLRSPEVR